ncbi:hypothetical protein BaRGS_00039231 [Batillaria attramentaria]|uniref:Uncharacterized protein n=1 Tax=Batillaria attramentaria TaxID=370345 RepID=A0ABD0J418_9CAEN
MQVVGRDGWLLLCGSDKEETNHASSGRDGWLLLCGSDKRGDNHASSGRDGWLLLCGSDKEETTMQVVEETVGYFCAVQTKRRQPCK